MMVTNVLRVVTKCSHAFVTRNFCPRHVLQAITRCSPARNSMKVLQNCDIRIRDYTLKFSGLLCTSRQLSTTSRYCTQLISADNVVSSPYPNQVIPTNEPFHSLIFKQCDEYKNEFAVVEFLTGKGYTYFQIKEVSVKVAKGLSKKGLRKGDVVLAYAPNCCEFTILMLACSCLGLCFSAASPTLIPDELARHIEHCEAQAVFTIPDLEDNLKKALELKNYTNKLKHFFVFGDSDDYQPFHTLEEKTSYYPLPDVDIDPVEDVFALPYSSGTTGYPNGVMLTHYNCLANVIQTVPSILGKRGDRALGILPLYHIYGLTFVQFVEMYAGMSLYMLPKFEPETFLRCMQDAKINYAALVPPLIVFMTKNPIAATFDMSTLEHVVSGAAPLGSRLTEEFRAKYPRVQSLNQGYGMTELSPVTHLDASCKSGSIGPLVANTQAKIVDIDQGRTLILGAGEQGELVIKGPQVMKGYYKNQEATNDMIQDDWLYTGDIGYFDKDGLFYITDRLKELIKYKGYQVPPAELEGILLAHPDVQDVAVIGIPDEAAGEVPKAFVVRKHASSVTQKELCEFVAGAKCLEQL